MLLMCSKDAFSFCHDACLTHHDATSTQIPVRETRTGATGRIMFRTLVGCRFYFRIFFISFLPCTINLLVLFGESYR